MRKEAGQRQVEREENAEADLEKRKDIIAMVHENKEAAAK